MRCLAARRVLLRRRRQAHRHGVPARDLVARRVPVARKPGSRPAIRWRTSSRRRSKHRSRLDAALKAAEVRAVKVMTPPTETNFAAAWLTGTLDECEAAAVAYAAAVVDVAATPKRSKIIEDADRMLLSSSHAATTCRIPGRCAAAPASSSSTTSTRTVRGNACSARITIRAESCCASRCDGRTVRVTARLPPTKRFISIPAARWP